MGKTKVKESKKPLTLSKVVVYILLILLAITIIIPVGWVFVASVKQNSEFYGSPWVLPEKIYFQNFIDAWEKASMGTYMLNSVIVTALALLLLIVISLPAACSDKCFRLLPACSGAPHRPGIQRKLLIPVRDPVCH